MLELQSPAYQAATAAESRAQRPPPPPPPPMDRRSTRGAGPGAGRSGSGQTTLMELICGLGHAHVAHDPLARVSPLNARQRAAALRFWFFRKHQFS